MSDFWWPLNFNFMKLSNACAVLVFESVKRDKEATRKVTIKHEDKVASLSSTGTCVT